jgi:4-hydroxybenzoate polyprenyltransferase
VIDKVKTYMELIKVEHTLFALPFALTAALMAADGFPSLYQLFWIVVALFGARTSAMSLNRLIDAEIDARNPRTADRHIPRGLVKKGEALALALAGYAIMLFSAYKLNELALKLSPIAILVLTLYSFTKRFTWLCHLVLGVAVALAPLGAWVAVKAQVELPAVLLSLAVAFWVAGFDVIYALQDVEFDRREGLYSIPAKLGVERALLLSRLFHLVTLLLLVSVGLLLKMGALYYLGLLVSSYFMFKEHSIVARDREKVAFAFFNLNGYISLTVFLFTFLDYLWRALWS